MKISWMLLPLLVRRKSCQMLQKKHWKEWSAICTRQRWTLMLMMNDTGCFLRQRRLPYHSVYHQPRMLSISILTGQQEEADTKMFLAAQFAFELGFERVNVITIDTDVVVLAIYFQELLNETIYLQYGTSTLHKFTTCHHIQ